MTSFASPVPLFFVRKVACEVIDLMTMESQSVMTDDVDEVPSFPSLASPDFVISLDRLTSHSSIRSLAVESSTEPSAVGFECIANGRPIPLLFFSGCCPPLPSCEMVAKMMC